MVNKCKAFRQEKAAILKTLMEESSVSRKKRGIDGIEEKGSYHDRESTFHSIRKRTKQPNKQKLEEVLIMVERAGWRWGRLPRRRELKFLEGF